MNPEWRRAEAAVEEHKKKLLAIPGVHGLSVSAVTESGGRQVCIMVFSNRKILFGSLADRMLPRELDGIPVRLRVTGESRAY